MNRYKDIENLLKNYNMIKVNIENMKQDIYFLKNDISIAGISYDTISTSPTNKVVSGVESKVMSIINDIEVLEFKIVDSQNIVNKIDRSIQALDARERNILVDRYLNNKQWYNIAYEMEYSERHCKRIRSEAIYKMIVGLYGVEG